MWASLFNVGLHYRNIIQIGYFFFFNVGHILPPHHSNWRIAVDLHHTLLCKAKRLAVAFSALLIYYPKIGQGGWESNLPKWVWSPLHYHYAKTLIMVGQPRLELETQRL